MAILKHNSSKNANYNDAIQYLTKKYNEKLNKPILDENDQLQERDEYIIKYFNSKGEEDDIENWERDCIETNLKYKKNLKKEDIKTHQYILAFEDADNLSLEKAMEYGTEFASKYFKGHQVLIAVHPGNRIAAVEHPGTHVHFILNSVRDREIEKENWMIKDNDNNVLRWQYAAGMKHHAGDDYMAYLKKQTMEFCKSKGLNQVDLLKKSKDKVRDKEYYAIKKADEKGKVTYKSYIKNVLNEAKRTCKSPKEFYELLKKYSIECEKRGIFYRYKTMDGTQWIRERSLGEAYYMDEILAAINKNKKKNKMFWRPGWMEEKEKKNKNRHHVVALYDDDGRRRSLIEQLLILAVVVVNKEVPEQFRPEWQREAHEKRLDLYVVSKTSRAGQFLTAVKYAEELKIETPEQLKNELRRTDLSAEHKEKLEYIHEQVKRAQDKDYCYGKIPERIKGLTNKSLLDLDSQINAAAHESGEKDKSVKPREKEDAHGL